MTHTTHPHPQRRAARTVAAVALLAGSLLAPIGAQAQESYTGWLFTLQRMKEVRPVTLPVYAHECGECHLAYQPGLLPARSWDALLTAGALREHFGTSAELDAATLREVRDYALAYAADRSYRKRSRKIAAATTTGPTPLRITQLDSIAWTHRQIPAARITGNPAVKSLSQCDACHTQALDGVYDNDTVSIPQTGH